MRGTLSARARQADPLRSPVPLLLGGALAALVLILVVALPARQPPVDPTSFTTLSEREALTLVAEKARSGEAARQLLTAGQARFEDGTWFITVGEARFYFSVRNRVVVPENDAAVALLFRDGRTP